MKKIAGLFVVIVAVLATGCTSKKTKIVERSEEASKIVIGSMGSDAEIWKFIAGSDLAKKANLEVEVVEIDGGSQLNTATVEGQVDVNAFQSLGYLLSFNEDSPDDLVPIATTYMEPMGIYSDRYKTIEEVEDGGVVALADNPSNTTRGLRLLEAAGLITLPQDFNDGIGTPSDIVDNPKQLEFKLIDDTTGPRIIQDVDLVLIGNTVALEGGFNVLKDAIYKEEVNENTKTSINVLVTVEDRADEKSLQKLADLYHSEEVQVYISDHLGGTKVDVQEDIQELWREM